MSLLAPLFVLGALAVAAPILAHLVRRSTRERVRFSATSFLDVSPPVVAKRKRIEHPWLLLLRVLVLAILALAFARPFFQGDAALAPAARTPSHLVVVMDQSASMQRGDLFQQALAQARALARSLRADDRLAIVGTTAMAPILRFEAWNSAAGREERQGLLEAALDSLRAGWGPTRLDAAIDVALEEVEAMNEAAGGAGPAEVAVVSDFAAGARLSGLAGRDWPAAVHVSLAPVQAAADENAALHLLGWSEVPGGTRAARLQLANHSARVRSIGLTVRDAVSGSVLEATSAQMLAPGERRVVRIEVADTHPEALRVDIADDGAAFDNTVWLLSSRPRKVAVGYLGAAGRDDATRSHYYLARALQRTATLDPDVIAIDPNDSALPEAVLYVVAERPERALEFDLRRRIENGALALVLVSNADLVAVAARLAGESGWMTKSYGRADALLGKIDFTHPQFALFSDPRFSDFTRVRFWQPVPLIVPESSQARIVAAFEDGSPALLEAGTGAGALLVWGGDWQPQAGQWVLSTKFVPWVQSLLLRACGGRTGATSAEMGDLERLGLGGEARWERVAGVDTDGNPETSPLAPGIYRAGEDGRFRLVALQVPAAESSPETIPLDTWEELGVPLTAASPRQAPSPEQLRLMRATDLEHEQKFWRWFLLAAVIVLAVEGIVSIRLAHRQAEPLRTG